MKSQDCWNPLIGSLENSVITGVISGTISESSSSTSSSSFSSGGGPVGGETDLGFRTSYSTVVVFLVCFFVLVVPNAPGRGAGSGLEGTYCDSDKDVDQSISYDPANRVTHRRREPWFDIFTGNLLLLFGLLMLQIVFRLLQELGHPLQMFIERFDKFLVQPRISTHDPEVLYVVGRPSQQTEYHPIVGSFQWGRRPFRRGLFLQSLNCGGEEIGTPLFDTVTNFTEALLYDGV